MDVSVIIPTYDRPAPLRRALQSLEKQTLAADRYEVIVVDDGSSTDMSRVVSSEFPLRLHVLQVEKAGATVARNKGAIGSRGRILVFMDDDVTAAPGALEALCEACLRSQRVLAMGNVAAGVDGGGGIFARIMAANDDARASTGGDDEVSYTHCNTQLLAVRREDFFEIGMLEDPTGGWPNWDDVDFGVRADRLGFRLLRCGGAQAVHWDRSLRDLTTSCERWYRASLSAVRLFEKYPDLRDHIPMFVDKTPIDWGIDSWRMVLRKLLRQTASSRPGAWMLRSLVRVCERVCPFPVVLRPLYLGLVRGAMLRGYKQGLRLTRSSAQP